MRCLRALENLGLLRPLLPAPWQSQVNTNGRAPGSERGKGAGGVEWGALRYKVSVACGDVGGGVEINRFLLVFFGLREKVYTPKINSEGKKERKKLSPPPSQAPAALDGYRISVGEREAGTVGLGAGGREKRTLL